MEPNSQVPECSLLSALKEDRQQGCPRPWGMQHGRASSPTPDHKLVLWLSPPPTQATSLWLPELVSWAKPTPIFSVATQMFCPHDPYYSFR